MHISLPDLFIISKSGKGKMVSGKWNDKIGRRDQIKITLSNIFPQKSDFSISLEPMS